MRTARFIEAVIVFVALAPGTFMTFDGSRALVAGDYLTPRTGRFAGQLGPWSHLVSAVGIPPRSTAMKIVFVAYGLAWLAATAAFVRRAPRSEASLAALAVATLWYLPVGTLAAVVVLAGLALRRLRPERRWRLEGSDRT